ncbi:MAG: galactokinase [Pirellulaceae bacterium]|nr:galactokinase [Pirellulaceae bacterium]
MLHDSDTCTDGRVSAVEIAVPLEQLVHRAETQFESRFGRSPRWIAAAPGRVNLIGEHTDYNDGFVLPMAIQRYVVIAADAAGGGDWQMPIRLVSSAVEQPQWISLDESRNEEIAAWARYVFGVMIGCRDQGMQPGPLDVLVDSNVPLGGGLSSSAALEVATATLIEAVTGRRLPDVDKALLCQQAEHRYAGVPCGIMDQFTSVLGLADHLMLLDCRSTTVTPVPMTDTDVQVLIVNSNVKHELTGGEYAQRRSQCERAAQGMGVASLRDATSDLLKQHESALEPVLVRRARHVIGEIARTTQAAEAVANGDWHRAGALMYESHASLRDDYEVSCAELDLLVELARDYGSEGMIGSRMTGGGFGGCTVSLVRREHLETVARAIRDRYQKQTGVTPTLFTTRPAQGAQIVRA